MKLIVAIIRPERLGAVRAALCKRNLDQMTVTQASGCGHEPGPSYIYRGATFTEQLLTRLRLEIALDEDDVDTALNAIQHNAQTGAVGDGIIWVYPLERALRIRNCEELNHPPSRDLTTWANCG